jgi:hypothetical protein
VLPKIVMLPPGKFVGVGGPGASRVTRPVPSGLMRTTASNTIFGSPIEAKFAGEYLLDPDRWFGQSKNGV